MASYTDPFTGSAYPYTTNWTNSLGNTIELYSDAVYCHEVGGVDAGFWIYSGGAFAADQYSRAVIGVGSGPSFDMNLVLRGSGTSCMRVNLYGTGPTTATLQKIIAGVLTSDLEHHDFATSLVDTNEIEFGVNGSIYYVKNLANSETITFASDTSLSSGSAGLYMRINGNTNWSSWAGGDLASSGSSSKLVGKLGYPLRGKL